MRQPLISVVTISFNQAQFIEQAIRSVIEQDYPNIEYIVVDPGSTDGSRDIIERFRNRITSVIYDKDNGPADGLNKGLAQCTGEFFCYLNSDDFFLPNAFKEAISQLQAHPDCAFINGDGYIVNENGKATKRFISAPFNLWHYAYGHSVVCQQSTFFRRSSVIRAGCFNEKNNITWDAELLINIVRNKEKSVLVHRYWSAFRIYENSITGSHHYEEAAKKSHDYLFHQIMGRNKSWYDKILIIPAKLIRWTIDPIGFFQRIRPLHSEIFSK